MKRMKIFGCFGVSREEIIVGYFLFRVNFRIILEYLDNSNNSRTLKEICFNNEQIPTSTIRYCLQNLVKVNLLQVQLINEQKVYSILDKYSTLVRKSLSLFGSWTS
ncbi:hypothetical protein NEF87_000582 [Candidatus Lokiarchaeum ossiferum]|uniref:Uncharacterized protein n=1 Tax=Candidatus Lokiarchaeum ossiferum TaxID=2951803 RepID=A0ABY6HLC2_9ARCH|nr:hypothetical protein NEF87_000582 [Candidatus Lokiarchaeum sp. B-35]